VLWQRAGLEFRPKGRDTETNITREVASGRSIVLLAEESEHKQVIGTVIATIDGRRGYINRLAVIPEYRCRGLAGKPVAAAE
jgi:ribosomal protein S18 acetylase RimI-like enzyme